MTASSSNNCPENKYSSNAKHDRKLRKPLIEKRRRERINCSLEQLKGIMVDAYNLDQSKLEKADVLEVTVQHMEGLQKGLGAASVDSTTTTTAGVGAAGFESRQRYSTGYIQCMHEVHNLLLSCPGMDKTLGAGLLNHLLKALPHVSAADAAACGPASPGSSPERGGGGHHPGNDWSSPNGHYGGTAIGGANNANDRRHHHHHSGSPFSTSSSSSPPTSPLSPETPRSPFRPRRLEMHDPSSAMMMPQAAAARHHHHQQRCCPPQSPPALLPEATVFSSYEGCFTPPRRTSTPASPEGVSPAAVPPPVEDPSMWRPW